MTEEEAKTKWCPFARGEQHSGGNRAPYGSPGDGPLEEDYTSEMAMRYPCIGSACMAWRDVAGADWAAGFRKHIEAGTWIEAIRIYRFATGSGLKDAKDFVDGVRGGTQQMPIGVPVGYCGLAGPKGGG